MNCMQGTMLTPLDSTKPEKVGQQAVREDYSAILGEEGARAYYKKMLDGYKGCMTDVMKSVTLLE